MSKIIKIYKGFTVVEIVVSAAIILLVGTVFTSVLTKTTFLSSKALRIVQTNSLLEEGAEVVKIIRENDWNTISGYSLNTNYYMDFYPYNVNENVWMLSTTPNKVDNIFTRTVVFSSVNRDSNDDIVTSGGTLDARTKKVTVTVSFNVQGTTFSKSLVFYITDIFN